MGFYDNPTDYEVLQQGGGDGDGFFADGPAYTQIDPVAIEHFRDEAAASAAASEASHQASQVSANASAASASAAHTSEVHAAASDADATAQAATATSQAGIATTQAANALASANSAAGNASSAATSATTATTQAGIATTQAGNAATSASQALASKNAAATSETNAHTSETNAAASASTATTQAGIATTKASNAATSETNAAASASAASTSATNAANSATAANTSKVNAGTSETNAAASATAAAGSASSASTSASTATTQAGNASTSASNAHTSEVNAASSASAAATSATNAAAAVQAAAGTASPLMDGAVAVGSATKWAHEDHRHPSDTTKADKTYVDTQDGLKAPLNSPALTGTPTAPTPTAGDNSTKIATTAFVAANGGGGGGGGIGQCKLVWSSNTLLALKPWDGNTIKINGANCSVPAAGVTIANTSLAASTKYYIYAWMNAGTMTLEASTTGYVADTAAGNIGTACKAGDSTRSLVGMVYVFSDGKFYDNQSNRFVRSWFNDVGVTLYSGTGSVTSTTSTGYVELDTNVRCSVLTWLNEEAFVVGAHAGFNNTSGQYAYFALAMDGVVQSVPIYTGYNGGQYTFMANTAAVVSLSEAAHTFSHWNYVSGGTGNFGNRSHSVITRRR